MGYFVRKNDAVYVYFHNAETGKNKPLPRKETRHLDGGSDSQVQTWMENYALTKGYLVRNTEAVAGDKWPKLVDEFLNSPEMTWKSPDTKFWYKKYLSELVLVYFVNLHGLNDPYQWTYKSAGMLAYLTNDRSVSDNISTRCNVALRAFWSFLIDKGEIHQSIALRLKNPRTVKNETPLQFVLTPKAALRLAKDIEDTELKLLLLLGYFCSMRPQESMSITRQDFFTKGRANSKECSKLMTKAKLFGGLVVNVVKQRTKRRDITTAKAGSGGFVACFDKAAAEQIVEIVKTFEGVIFDKGNDYYYKEWAKRKTEVTLKDLRRSSLYWLGHNSKLTPTAIMNHARHKKSETTDKYLRRPVEHEDFDTALDL